jgi:hypothetical protein
VITAGVRTEQGKLYMCVTIDRTSKLAFVKLEAETNRYTASDFLRALVAFVPYKIDTVLTDNGVQFCLAPRNRSGQTALYSPHIIDRVCHKHGIGHLLAKPNHPWTNGQVKRMNRAIKDATVKRYYYDTHEQLHAHLQLFVDAYKHARRLKTLRGLTPYEHVLQDWTEEPKRFRLDPSHLIPEPYTRTTGSRPSGADQPNACCRHGWPAGSAARSDSTRRRSDHGDSAGYYERSEPSSPAYASEASATNLQTSTNISKIPKHFRTGSQY